MSPLQSRVAANLRALREDRDLARGTLAAQLGYSLAAVQKWEIGENLPSLVALVDLSTFFRVSLDTIVFAEDPRQVTSYRRRQ